MSIARVLVMIAVVAVLAANWLLGTRHVLASCGLITLVVALVCGLGSSGGQPLSPAQTFVATAAGFCVAVVLYLLDWHVRAAALIPAFIQALLAILVARTLRPARVPVIERIGAAMQPDGAALPPEVQRYARQSTCVWAWLFAALAALNAGIVLRGWPMAAPVWPLGLIDIAAAAMLLVAEYFYRRARFTTHNRHTLAGFLLGLRKISLMRLLLARGH